MKGYFLFLEKLYNLSVDKRNEIIGKIFNIKVKAFDLEIKDEKIYIKIYDGYIYYHFCFVKGDCYEDDLSISFKDRIVVCRFFVDNLLDGYLNEKIFKKDFCSFLKIIVKGEINHFASFL